MLRKVITIPAECEGHIKNILENNSAEITGIVPEYFEESKYHSNGKYSEVAFIGEFSVEEDDTIDEKVIFNKIEYKGNIYNYQIHVYSNEGPIPHFHVLGNGKDICICIYEPRYFDHGVHVGTLSIKELKALDEFLRTPYTKRVKSYWDRIANAWDDLNMDNKVRYPNYIISDTQPDYTHMQGFKSGKTY